MSDPIPNDTTGEPPMADQPPSGHVRKEADGGELPATAKADSRQTIPIKDLYPCPENDVIYGPVHDDDPAILALAADIRKNGVAESLIVSQDWYVVSGHRRLAAARLAGLDRVPYRVVSLTYADDRQLFLDKLCALNLQRVKSPLALTYEAVLSASQQADAYSDLLAHRKAKADSKL